MKNIFNTRTERRILRNGKWVRVQENINSSSVWHIMVKQESVKSLNAWIPKTRE